MACTHGPARAQSVDIAEELKEGGEPKVPLLQVYPWQWLRNQWLEAADMLNRQLGLQAGLSFTTIYQHAAGLSAPNNTCVANLDVYGRWKLLDLGPLGVGTAGFLFRNRSNWAQLTGNELSASIGLPWGVNNSLSADYTRFNQVWWEQTLLERALVLKFGKIDETSLFDQNRVAGSDKKQFFMQTLVHSQTIAFPSNGIGFNLRYMASQHLYLTAGFGDANGNPDLKPSDSLSSFAQGQYFEAAEVGWSPDLSSLWAGARQGTYRFTGWNTAATSSHSSGAGFAVSFDQEFGGGIVPFLRVGYCPDDVFRTSVDVSWGVATQQPFQRTTDRAGIAASWGKPVAAANRDQFALELFYRLEVVEGIQISPDIELIIDPALEPSRDFVAVLGVRTRLSL